MYSDISIRTMLCSSSNRASARAFASSVLPTPVGPKNRNEPIGWSGFAMPALERSIASLTFSTASSWPITRLWSISSIWSNFSRSPSISFETGIPVQRQIIFAISSSVTLSWSIDADFDCSASFSSSSSSFCNWGSLPYLSSAALFRS